MKSTLKTLALAAFLAVGSALNAQQTPETSTVDDGGFIDFTKIGGQSSTPATPPQNTGGVPTPTQGGGGTARPAGSPAPKVEESDLGKDLPADTDAPLDGIVERKLIMEKQVLPWETVRESDIMWSKRIWRVIDVREKINLPFIYPEMPFFKILMKGVQDSVIKAYKAENDKFYYRLSPQEASTIGVRVDTITKIDPNTYETKIEVVRSEIDVNDIKRFRVKEEWYFDKQYSRLYVRILGIAPLKDVKDDMDNFLYEQPLFWIRYPDCREYLARHRVFMDGNDSNPMSWEDLFEMRRFSSYIFKESNVYNRRLQTYLQGIDILLEGEKIKQEIFNFEHDLWQY